jgi:hypothetical protein
MGENSAVFGEEGENEKVQRLRIYCIRYSTFFLCAVFLFGWFEVVRQRLDCGQDSTVLICQDAGGSVRPGAIVSCRRFKKAGRLNGL